MIRRFRLCAIMLGLLLSACNAGSLEPRSTSSPTKPPVAGLETPGVQPTPAQTPEGAATANPSPTSPGTSIMPLPPNAEVTITMIEMQSVSAGWAIGGIGSEDHVLITQDGGNTWRDVTPPQPINSDVEGGGEAQAFFHDANTALVTYADPIESEEDFQRDIRPVVWSTIDGGRSWRMSRPLDFGGVAPRYSPLWFDFPTPDHGWLMTWLGVGLGHEYVAFFRTEDGGLTWSRLFAADTTGPGVETDYLNICCKSGMDFADAGSGMVTFSATPADQLILDWTEDGGRTWKLKDLPGPETETGPIESPGYQCGTYSPRMFSASVASLAVRCNLEAGQRSFLYTTTDGGLTWRSRAYPGGELHWANPELGWALGMNLYETADGGETWLALKTVTWAGQFSIVDEHTVWAVATSGDAIALVASTDGMKTWRELKPRISP